MDNHFKSAEQRQLPDDDTAIYVPDDVFQSFHNIFDMMKEAQWRLHQVAEEIKPVESFE